MYEMLGAFLGKIFFRLKLLDIFMGGALGDKVFVIVE